MKLILDWLDDRLGYREWLEQTLWAPLPGGAAWKYVWGRVLMYLFGVQIVTGLLLWTAFSASAVTAWESVYYIQHVMHFGWFIRGLHQYAAQAMMVCMAAHLLQLVYAGAYRAPRELNWWLGLILMHFVVGMCLTGNWLPWDQKGYYAMRVVTNLIGSAPVVGPLALQFLRGGPQFGHETVTHLLALHAGVFPLLLALGLVVHLRLVRRQGLQSTAVAASPASITAAGASLATDARSVARYWPDQAWRDVVAMLGVLAGIVGMTLVYGTDLSGPADASEPFNAARPEWYFLFLFKFRKYEFIEQHGLAFGAVYLPGAIMGVLFLMPILGRWAWGHRFNVAYITFLALGMGWLTYAQLAEDAANPEHQASLRLAEHEGRRAVALANEHGIPAAGARQLLAGDPLTQGPRIFAKSCAACHRYQGHDGQGSPVLATGENGQSGPAPMTAPDLGGFGRKAWLKAVLLDFATVMKPTELATANGAAIGERFTNGDMANWSKENRELLSSPENAASLEALLAFLEYQSGETSESSAVASSADQLAAGRAIFATGQLASGSLSAACADCHSLTARGETAPLSTAEGTGAPTLTGYAGREWLTEFIRNPGHARFYGERNAMPAFAEQLSADRLDLLVRWFIDAESQNHK